MPIGSETVAPFVTLAGGVTVSVAALDLVLKLERRGARLSRDGGDLLLHRPCDGVTADERQLLKAMKADILAIVDYVGEARQ
jgi:hypothetical protein